MDLVHLRVEMIRIDLFTNQQTVDLLARRHLAVLAAALTTGAAGLLAAAIGQTGWIPAAIAALVSGIVITTQVRALGRLVSELAAGKRNARRAIETLIAAEGETNVDEASP